MTYPSVYRAKAVDISAGVITAFVPQVFGETTITITEALSALPQQPEMGWVFFQAGNPEFPVWAGDLVTADSATDLIGEIVAGGAVHSVKAGTGIFVNNTDVLNPIVSNTGVLSVSSSAGAPVNNTNPQAPVVLPQLPAGGTTNQFLVKNSATNYDYAWAGASAAMGFLPLSGGTITGNLTVNGSLSVPGGTLAVGDDAYFRDVNIADTIALISNTSTGRGRLAFGTDGNQTTTSSWIAHDTWGFDIHGYPEIYLDGNNINIRDSAYNSIGVFNSNGLSVGAKSVAAEQFNAGWTGYWFGASNLSGWYIDGSSAWIRGRNNYGLWMNTGRLGSDGGLTLGFGGGGNDAGHIADVNGYMRVTQRIDCGGVSASGVVYAGSGMQVPNGQALTVIDANHGIRYSGAYPAYSGEASNGPQVFGWGTVWLHTIAGGYGGNYGWDAFLSPNGHFFINPGGGFYNFSSREFKDNIRTLDPQECLDQVLAWRPVEYDQDVCEGEDMVVRHSTGFVSEEMVEVTPTAVNITGPNNERPGWANAMNYPSLTVQLAGAVQALAAEVRALKEAA